MKDIVILGNEHIEEDSMAVKLSKELEGFNFIHIKDSFTLMSYLNENNEITIIDVVQGLNQVKEIELKDLRLDSILSAHDLDASFILQLLGDEKKIKIIGVPMQGDINIIKNEVEKLIK